MITTIIVAVVAVIFLVLAPLLSLILDTIVTLIFTIIHAGMVFVIKNIISEFMVKTTMFTDEKDVVYQIIQTYLPIFRTIAISVIALIAMWQLFKTFFEYAGFSTEVEEPWKLGIKLMIFAALIWESKHICYYIIKMFEDVIAGREVSVKEGPASRV